MQYPLISEYIESVKDADNFATLTDLRPVLDNNGNPVMSSGNFAVVFKMTDGENNYAVKCFTREQEGRGENYRLICEELNKVDSPYILKIRYLEKEIFVDTNQTDETEFPVLAMDWVEGKTLSAFLSDIAKEYDNNHELWSDKETQYNLFELRCMPTNFLWMTKWLLKQPFAHGDLKPDNIVVQENGTCVLIDYDGMFVPSMQGMPIACGGTQNFRYPYNRNQNLCKAVDNYAIAIIALSLQAFAIRPDLISKSSEFCIISESDVLSNKYLQRLTDQEELTSDKSFQDLLSVFMHVLSRNTLTSEWFEETIGEILVPSDLNIHDTEASKLDLESCWIDKYGVKYSLNGKKVLGFSKKLEKDYSIREGVLIVCDRAFQKAYSRNSKKSITISESVNSIGEVAFANNDNLVSCNIPSSVVYVCNNNPWGGCFYIKNMFVQSSHFVIEDGILYSSDFTIAYGLIYWHQRIKINSKTHEIAANAFWSSRYEGKHPIIEVTLENVKIIGKKAFMCCSFADFTIKNSLEKIGEDAFFSCKKLREIDVKDVSEIPNSAFFQCENLTSVVIGHKVARIERCAFLCCSKIENITIPEVTEFISNAAFLGCNSLKNIIVDKENQNFASVDGVLFNKEMTSLIKYPGAKTPKVYEIPLSVKRISDFAFYDIKCLEQISSKQIFTSFGKSIFPNNCSVLCDLQLSQDIDRESLRNFGENLYKSFHDSFKVQGLSYIKKAADLGCSDAQWFLINGYKENKFDAIGGESKEGNYSQYKQWLWKASRIGDVEAKYQLAKVYEEEAFSNYDLEDAMSMYEEIADVNEEAKRSFLRLKKELYGYDTSTQTFFINGVSFDMIHVEGGTFRMGALEDDGKEYFDNEKPIHSVTLSSYAIGEYVVTQKLWKIVMGNNPSHYQGDNLPVENVSWEDCQIFIEKINGITGKKFRLPTEAEWEYAARGGRKNVGYKYSGSNVLDDVSWYNGNDITVTHPVGTKKPNELGIYDMCGNVLEWCSDFYSDYTSDSVTNPMGPSQGYRRVFRGGHWSRDGLHLGISKRLGNAPHYKHRLIGFRLALSTDENKDIV